MQDGKQYVRFTDGVVTDRFVEFAYFPKSVLQQLYLLNSVGCIDAIERYIQLVVTSPKILRTPNVLGMPETERLHQALDSVGRMEVGNAVFKSPTRSAQALAWIQLNWSKFENSLCAPGNEHILDALIGHTRAEFWRCFVSSDPQPMKHYVRLKDSIYISGQLRSLLLGALTPYIPIAENGLQAWWKDTNAGDQQGISFEINAATEIWLNWMVTTHYCNCFENFNFSDYDYVPAATRCDLRFLVRRDNVVDELYDQHLLVKAVFPSIAAKVLEKALEAGGRDYVVPNLIAWCKSDAGREVTAGFQELSKTYNDDTAIGRKNTLEEIGKLLRVSYEQSYYQLTVANMRGLLILKTVNENEPPQPLAWLHRLRHHDANARLKELVEKLVEM